MVGIRFGGGRDELLTFMQYLGVITPPYLEHKPTGSTNSEKELKS